MNPVMYIFVNKGAKMSVGKMAAQVGHAAVRASDHSDDVIKRAWNSGGHYCKLVMQARDAEHLWTIYHYLKERGIKCFPIIDEGLNEIQPHTFVALGVEIVDKDDQHILDTFSTFELYKDKKKWFG